MKNVHLFAELHGVWSTAFSPASYGHSCTRAATSPESYLLTRVPYITCTLRVRYVYVREYKNAIVFCSNLCHRVCVPAIPGSIFVQIYVPSCVTRLGFCCTRVHVYTRVLMYECFVWCCCVSLRQHIYLTMYVCPLSYCEMLDCGSRVVDQLQQHGEAHTPVSPFGTKHGDATQVILLDFAQSAPQHCNAFTAQGRCDV